MEGQIQKILEEAFKEIPYSSVTEDSGESWDDNLLYRINIRDEYFASVLIQINANGALEKLSLFKYVIDACKYHFCEDVEDLEAIKNAAQRAMKLIEGDELIQAHKLHISRINRYEEMVEKLRKVVPFDVEDNIEFLKTLYSHLKYAEGGNGYEKAKEHFEKLI